VDQDDAPVGRVLSRREALGLLGGAGLALLITACTDGASEDGASPTASGGASSTATEAATGAPSTVAGSAEVALPACVVRPEQTEGPYFVDEGLMRSDIRVEPSDGTTVEGAPLALTFRALEVGAGSCAPLANALVDVWQCDALGVYSGVVDFGGNFDASGLSFLRGQQVTDGDGQASFVTIYPGWYQGRATHIHFKIRTEASHEFTSQLYFDDALSDQVHASGVYASRGAVGRTQNSQDGIFGAGGSDLLLDVAETGDGFASTFNIGLDLT